MVRSTFVAAAPNPVPLTGTATVAFAGSLLASSNAEEAGAVAEGAYRTVTSTDLPLPTVNGVTGETILNNPATPAIEETRRSAAPTLVTVSFESFVWPTETPPKSSDAGATTMDGCAFIELLPERAMVTLSLTGS